MQKTGWLFSTALLCLLFLGSGFASAAPQASMSELQAAGGFFHTQGSDSGSLNADLSYGYYFTPGWQLGFRQGLNYNFVDDRIKAIDNNASHGNHVFNIGIGLTWGGARNP